LFTKSILVVVSKLRAQQHASAALCVTQCHMHFQLQGQVHLLKCRAHILEQQPHLLLLTALHASKHTGKIGQHTAPCVHACTVTKCLTYLFCSGLCCFGCCQLLSGDFSSNRCLWPSSMVVRWLSGRCCLIVLQHVMVQATCVTATVTVLHKLYKHLCKLAPHAQSLPCIVRQQVIVILTA
jgi:hypothetical protein